MTIRTIAPSFPTAARLFALAAFALGGLALGACQDLDGTGELRTDISCDAYCRQAKECDDDVDLDDCKNDCAATVDDCMADEQEEALDQLDECSDVACDEFDACTVDAGAQCFFGL